MNATLIGLPITVVGPCVALPQAPVGSLDFWQCRSKGKPAVQGQAGCVGLSVELVVNTALITLHLQVLQVPQTVADEWGLPMLITCTAHCW